MRTYAQARVIITGAASGIGLAMARRLLDQGAHVMLADCDETALANALASLEGFGERVRAHVVDVTQAASVEAMVHQALADWGHIDYLFNNAGIGGSLPIGSATLDHWHRIVDINLWGVIHGVHAVLPHMLSRRSGHIVNTASISGLVPFPGQALYNTTKYAVVGLSETLRHELRNDGVRVTVACPGPVASGIWGVPILGMKGEARPPAGAVPAAEAADCILTGVARGDGIVAFPTLHRWLWRWQRWLPAGFDRWMAKRQARQAAAPRSVS